MGYDKISSERQAELERLRLFAPELFASIRERNSILPGLSTLSVAIFGGITIVLDPSKLVIPIKIAISLIIFVAIFSPLVYRHILIIGAASLAKKITGDDKGERKLNQNISETAFEYFAALFHYVLIAAGLLILWWLWNFSFHFSNIRQVLNVAGLTSDIVGAILVTVPILQYKTPLEETKILDTGAKEESTTPERLKYRNFGLAGVTFLVFGFLLQIISNYL